MQSGPVANPVAFFEICNNFMLNFRREILKVLRVDVNVIQVLEFSLKGKKKHNFQLQCNLRISRSLGDIKSKPRSSRGIRYFAVSTLCHVRAISRQQRNALEIL